MANWRQVTYVRFGSLAALLVNISLMTAFGCKADVRFEQKPIFDSPLSAKSGRSFLVDLPIEGTRQRCIDLRFEEFL